MSRRSGGTALADPYWTTRQTTEDGKDGEKVIVHYKCAFCSLEWRGLTGTKRVVHLCQLAGEGIDICKGCVPEKVVELLLPTTKPGKEFIKQREQTDAGKAARKAAAQPTLEDMDSAALTTEIDDLIGRAHFTQGNIADRFWENLHLRKALKKLAKAQPFDYEPPKRLDFPRKLLP